MNKFTIDGFEGDFEFLPLRAEILFGVVPLYPTDNDFQNASADAYNYDDVAAHWRLEAIRFRRKFQGKCLDVKEINRKVAARIFPLVAQDVS